MSFLTTPPARSIKNSDRPGGIVAVNGFAEIPRLQPTAPRLPGTYPRMVNLGQQPFHSPPRTLYAHPAQRDNPSDTNMLKTKDPETLRKEPMAARRSVHRAVRIVTISVGVVFVAMTAWPKLRLSAVWVAFHRARTRRCHCHPRWRPSGPAAGLSARCPA